MNANAKYADAGSPWSRFLYGALIFASVSTLTVLAVRNGSYYDDEIFNINTAGAYDFRSLWNFINSTDVHPPGSYIINKLLFDLFGSWEIVKIVSGLLNAAALAVFGLLAFNHFGSTARWALAILLMLSSTQVLWGASVRWYAYFNPVFATALGIILFSGLSITKRTIILGVSIVLLFYISYAALCAAPALIAAHLVRERSNLGRRDFAALFLAGSISFLICLPQLMIFLRVHMAGEGGQTGSLVNALAQTAITLLIGNSVFPVAIAPLAYAVLVVALGAYFLFWKPKSQLDWAVLTSLAIGVLAMVGTGIGVKPRNSVFLLPLVFLVVASSLESLRPIASRGLIALIAVFQLIGAANVVEHHGTIKGSYDTDFVSAMRTIDGWKKQCKGRFVVFDHDVVLGRLLDDAEITQSSPYGARQQKAFDLVSGDCVAFVKTYRASFKAETLAGAYKVMETAGLRAAEAKEFSKDSNAAAKSWVGHEEFPQYLIQLQLDNVVSPVSLPAWDFPCPGCANSE